ncbi:MAG: Rieske 2Fe-2S domain-containing protein [Acidimicrobiia bacterium]
MTSHPATTTHRPSSRPRALRNDPVAAIASSVPADVVEPVRRRVESLVPAGPWKDALSGTWLGHTLHPMLTDLPIGCWTSAVVLDLAGGRAARPAAQRLVGLGIVSAIPTAATGASDWSDTGGDVARVGAVHAASNTLALVCFGASWLARRRGHHFRGVALGLLGAGAATVGGYLGGHLVSALGVGVDQTAFSNGADDWAPVASDAVVHDQELTRARAGETAVMLVREEGELVCLGARCPHRGAPMEQGERADGAVTCPWHGSRFSLRDGSLLRGPATTPLPTFECRVADGVIEVRHRRTAGETVVE